MKIYKLERIQKIPCILDKAWDFFSSPANLKTITPDYLGFEITSELVPKMYPGQIITYKVRPVLGIAMNWMTEITQVEDKKYFVDEQRIGPYSIWHHEHFFKAIEGGTEMKDRVYYAIHPLKGGSLTHTLFVKKKLNEIFDYRIKKVNELFGEWTNN